MTENDQTMLEEVLPFSSIRSDPAPVYDPDIKMETYSLSQRYRWAKADLDKLDKEVLTMHEVARLLRMPLRGCQRWVKKHLLPIGAVEVIGRSYVIYVWGLRQVLSKPETTYE